MPKIDLYGVYMSPPCRGAILTARAVGVDVNVIQTNPMKGDTKTPEFLAMNPQHCIPTIKDGDFTLWESRPISAYLAQKYGKGTGLYPECVEKRAQVDRMCHFDMGTLWQRFLNYVIPVVFAGGKPDPSKLDSLMEAFGMLDKMLAGHKFAVGDTTTVADHGLIAGVSSIAAAGIDVSKFTNVTQWMTRCKQWAYYDEGQKGLEDFGNFFRSKLSG